MLIYHEKTDFRESNNLREMKRSYLSGLTKWCGKRKAFESNTEDHTEWQIMIACVIWHGTKRMNTMKDLEIGVESDGEWDITAFLNLLTF